MNNYHTERGERMMRNAYWKAQECEIEFINAFRERGGRSHMPSSQSSYGGVAKLAGAGVVGSHR